MEKIDIRENFPVMNGGEGIILSKRGDITVGWEMTLPPAFRCNEQHYDSILGTLSSAFRLLPDYTVLHRQDIFMKKHYRAEKVDGFLEEAYERHFDGREYLDHRCYLWLCFSSRKNIHSAPSGIMGLGSPSLPGGEQISRILSCAEQFGSVIGSNSLLSLRRLTEEDIFGSDDLLPDEDTVDSLEDDNDGPIPDAPSVGILQDYLNFTDGGDDILSDIALSPDRVRVGDKEIVCHLFSDLDQLPSEVSSCRRIQELSTENSDVSLSFLHPIAEELDCEHIVNSYIVKEPLKDIHGALDTRRRQMQSLSVRNTGNRKYAEEINDYLENAVSQQTCTVRCHLNVLSAGPVERMDRVKDKVTAAISKLGLAPVRDISGTPSQFWSSIPGNESGLSFGEYMTMDLGAALCLGIYDGYDDGIEDGVLKMSDRLRLIPQRFDIQERAFDEGLIENYNVFLLGPSGSGKSFFMNKYLRSCYAAGQHCFLIDVGDSYRALCNIIREESRGHDGTLYTFEKGKPLSFNPFRNVSRFDRNADNRSLDFLYTLMCTLWKGSGNTVDGGAMQGPGMAAAQSVTPTELKFVKDSVNLFLAHWQSPTDPVFNDYYDFLKVTFPEVLKEQEVGKEYFDLTGYLIALGQFYSGGPYDYLLNSPLSVDILRDRFVVFEIDRIKDDRVIYPITTLVIMDAFMEKMTSILSFKVMCIEEAWKAVMGSQMATYMLELWKTARKHRTSAMVVTQELGDITSSPIIKGTIVENSGVKILLDQTKYLNRFDELARELSLSEDDKSMVLSLNRVKLPGGKDRRTMGREVFVNLGNRKSFVMRLEVSPEERLSFSSQKKDKERLSKAVQKSGGSYIRAIRKLLSKDDE